MMFLTHDELTELTGKKVRSAQVKALRGMGITHKVRADGSAAVLTAHVEKLLDGAPKGVKDAPRPQPDFSSLR